MYILLLCGHSENKISMKKLFASRFFLQNNQTGYHLSFKRRKRTFSKDQNIKPTDQRTLKLSGKYENEEIR